MFKILYAGNTVSVAFAVYVAEPDPPAPGKKVITKVLPVRERLGG
jgi:hypothetical protein